MVATNELLSVSLALISNFVSTVNLPQSYIPAGTQDIYRYHLGSWYAPLNTYVACRNGNEFWIQNGVVQAFTAPERSASEEDLNWERSLSATLLTSNQVVEMAVGIVERLVKTNNPTTGIKPIVRVTSGVGEVQRKVYSILWPTRKRQHDVFNCVVSARIDARRAQLVDIDLRDDAFWDQAFATELSNRFYRPDPPKATIAAPRLPKPDAKLVAEGLALQVKFASRLGMQLSGMTNAASVDWEKTYVYTNRELSTAVPVCRVAFIGGGGFAFLNGSVLNIHTDDACYPGDWGNKTKEHWDKFQGAVTKRWEDLAKGLEGTLVQKVGLPDSMLNQLDVEPIMNETPVGERGLKRVLLKWRKKSVPAKGGVREALFAEFDVETGQLKLLAFWDPALVGALRRALSQDFSSNETAPISPSDEQLRPQEGTSEEPPKMARE